MARCGRCGLYNQYPADHKEQKYAGVCLWFQHRLMADDVYERRECTDFFEAIPGISSIQHFDYKLKRDNLGEAYVAARRGKLIAYTSLGISITALLSRLLS